MTPGKLIHQDPDPEVNYIFMDIRMPNINGIELCHALRKKYSNETIFVALTAHVFSQEKQQLIDEGFNTILSKPFREEELLQVLGLKIQEQKVSRRYELRRPRFFDVKESYHGG